MMNTTTNNSDLTTCPVCSGKGRERGYNDLGEWEDDLCGLCMGEREVPEEVADDIYAAKYEHMDNRIS
jgi:hypothetical protein